MTVHIDKPDFILDQYVGCLEAPSEVAVAAMLADGVALTELRAEQPDPDQPAPCIYRECLMLYPGTFQAIVNGKPGEFVVTEGHVQAAYENFATNERRVSMQKNHDMDVDKKIGDVVAFRLDKDAMELYGLCQIVCPEGVRKVYSGLYCETSMGARGYSKDKPESFTICENSVVAAGALPRAGFKEKGKDTTSMPAPVSSQTQAQASQAAQPNEPVISAEQQQGLSFLARMAQFFSGGGSGGGTPVPAPAPAPVAASLPPEVLQTLKEQKETISAMNQLIQGLVQDSTQAKATAILTSYVKSGQVPPASVKALEAHVATLDAEQVKTLASFLGKLPKLAELGFVASNPSTDDMGEVDADDQAYLNASAKRAGEDPDDQRDRLGFHNLADSSGVVSPKKGGASAAAQSGGQ